MKNEVVALSGASPRAIETIPLTCFVSLNSGARLCTSACCLAVSCAERLESAPVWITKPGATRWNAMPLYTPAAARRMNWRTVFGSLVDEELDRDRTGARIEHGAVRAEFRGGLGDEWLGRRIADRHVADLDPLGDGALLVDRRLGDLLQHLDPVRDVREHGVLVVERRLIGEHDEELRPRAVGLARHEHGRHRSARHLRRTRFGLHHVLSARAVQRSLGRVLRQRIAALDHAVFHGPMECRAVVRALRCELHEVGGLVRRRRRIEIQDEDSRATCRPPPASAAPAPVATDKKKPQRPQSTQRTTFLSDLGDLRGSIFSCLLSVPRPVDDLPRVPDVVQAGDDRNRQRHPDTDVDDQRVVAEIVEQHRRNRGHDVSRGGDLSVD